MKVHELKSLLEHGHRPVIQFTQTATDYDEGMVPGMLGIVEGVREVNGFLKFRINCENYFEHNLPLFTHDYLNKETGEYTATAVESGHYPKDHIVEVYEDLDPESDIQNFEYIKERSPLFKQYMEENPGMDYVTWLEHKVIALQSDNSQTKDKFEIIVSKTGAVLISAADSEAAANKAKSMPIECIDWYDETNIVEVHQL